MDPAISEKYYAHSLPGRPPAEWQPLEKHLKNVAALAREFAESFGAGECHGLGKVLISISGNTLSVNQENSKVYLKIR
ncbi:MAG: hypothetical protein ABSE95_13025 [Thermodesulfobacteriota bacterium]|jgi:hypothetical protein